MEVLDGNGQLVGYGVIEKIPLTAQGIANLFLEVVWKDEQDRFYVIDRTYQPVIRVVELEIRPTDKTLG